MMKAPFAVRLMILAALSLVGVSMTPLVVMAAPMTYFGEDLGLGELTPLPAHPNADMARAAFLAMLTGGIGTETLEAFATGTSAPLPVVFPSVPTPITATLLGAGYVAEVLPGQTNGVGRYPISGTKYWETNDVFSITFDQPVAAFGFYGIDVGDFSGQLILTLTDGSTLNLTIPHTVDGPGGTIIFFGVIDTENQYTAVSFGNTMPGWDYFGFDDFTVGSIRDVVTPYALDIHPTSCPNPINVKSRGVTPVAILGSENGDVSEIDVTTIRLEGVAPIRSGIDDVAGPVENPEPEPCECTTRGADGFPDLTLKFDTPALVAALSGIAPGTKTTVKLTGKKLDGTSFELTDCVLMRPAASKSTLLAAESPPEDGLSWGMLKAFYR